MLSEDNALIRSLKAAVQKLKSVIETTVPALASAMETVRQNIIVFNYGLLHIRNRKREMIEYMQKATANYSEYLDRHEQIKEKQDKRKTLQTELDSLGVFSISRRRELKGKIAELSEEIEELHFEEIDLMQGFGKEDIAGMKEVKTDISEAEADKSRLEKQETTLTDAIGQEKEKFTELKEQASNLDRYDLTDARLALRPKMEAQAQARIQGAVSSGRVSLWDFQVSVSDADRLLEEDGMAERWEYEKRQKACEIICEPQRKQKEHSHTR